MLGPHRLLAAACGETGNCESANLCSKISSDRAIDLEEFDRRASDLDESDYHSRTRAVRGDDHFLPAQGVLQVVHLERHMRDGLHQVGNGRTIPVALPSRGGVAVPNQEASSSVHDPQMPG